VPRLRNVLAALLLPGAIAGLLIALWLHNGRRASGPLPQEAYVWQRSWGPEIRRSVGETARETPALSGLVAFAAEVDLGVQPPRIARADLNFAALRRAGKAFGLALRIGPFSRPGAGRALADDPDAVRALAGLAKGIAAAAQAQKLPLREIQLDYDCPESRLGEYPLLIRAVRQAVAPVPVTITALPAWLRHRSDFTALIGSADGYVLQLHSLAPPRRFDAEVLLCDPAAARRAVDAAARFRRPFRVALPTYGYVVAFDSEGKVLGLSAEGPLLAWPRAAVLRVARSDPDTMAGLVREWTANRPAELAGILWYRLPNAADRLNWPWPAFRAVLAGRSPRRALRLEPRRIEPGLVEVGLANSGEADALWPTPVTVTWAGAPLLACDGLAGYRVRAASRREIRLERDQTPWDHRFRPGERRLVAWLRFAGEADVQATLPPVLEPPG